MSIVPHRNLDYIGATPDGFVIMQNPITPDFNVKERLLEIKCPTTRVIHPFSNSMYNICKYDYAA